MENIFTQILPEILIIFGKFRNIWKHFGNSEIFFLESNLQFYVSLRPPLQNSIDPIKRSHNSKVTATIKSQAFTQFISVSFLCFNKKKKRRMFLLKSPYAYMKTMIQQVVKINRNKTTENPCFFFVWVERDKQQTKFLFWT